MTMTMEGGDSLAATEVTCPLCVVLDTNIWIESLLLRTATGAALLHYLSRSGNRVGLPEVVEREIARHTARRGQEIHASLEQAATGLGRITGVTPAVTYGSLDFLAAVAHRLDDLQGLLVRVPFTRDHALRALDRVDAGTPPNGPKNQQFKDSAIWEAVIELAREYRILLVTEDRGFFENRDGRSGLAYSLQEECGALGLDVSVRGSIADCLTAVKAESAPLDHEVIARLLATALRDMVGDEVGKHQAELGVLRDHAISAFCTERHDVLAITFSLVYSGSAVSADASETVSVTVSGEAAYNCSSRVVSDVRLGRMEIASGAGELSKVSAVVYVSGTCTIGPIPPAPLTIREPVE